MERSKAIASIVGISLGLITMPLLGPFSALVTGLSALMTAKAFERNQRSKTNGRRDSGDDTKLTNGNDLSSLNQYLPSSLPNNLNAPRYPRSFELPDIPIIRIPSIHDVDLSRPVNPRPQRGRNKGIHIDKYGRMIDPTD